MALGALVACQRPSFVEDSVSPAPASVNPSPSDPAPPTPPTPVYWVGGSVQGLVGAGLVLELNAGEQLAVPASADHFQFTKKVLAGAYSIRIVQQPVDPIQICALRGEAGSVPNADVESVTVTCVTGTVRVLAGVPSGAGSRDGTGARAYFNTPIGLTVDQAGNAYVADSRNGTIRKITPAGVVTTWIGQAGQYGDREGTGTDARLTLPWGLTIDTDGNIYLTEGQLVAKVTPDGVLTRFAGTLTRQGSADGSGAEASFSNPRGIAADLAGNLYVADAGNHTVRKISPEGDVRTLAGSAGRAGSADGQGAAARFNFPSDVAVDAAGNVYVTDSSNATVRKITPGGLVSTLAGLAGRSDAGGTDGTGASARFLAPIGITVDPLGYCYVTDNQTVRRISPAGEVTTIAGTAGVYGDGDRLNNPLGIALDAAGALYVADSVSSTIRKLTTSLSYLAGSPPGRGFADGTAIEARFADPAGIVKDAAGNLYVADTSNLSIRKITPTGFVSALAGIGTPTIGQFSSPQGIAMDGAGALYVADGNNAVIRKVGPGGNVSTFAGMVGQTGQADGTGTAARFNFPSGVAVDQASNVYVADTGNHTIRKITPAGVVTTWAGRPGVAGVDDGTGTAARFSYPRGLALDADGNVYVADTDNHAIRKITPDGDVHTLAGAPGLSGYVDGPPADARFLAPYGVAVDDEKNVYVADYGNGALRMITPAGLVSTLVGVPGMQGITVGSFPASLFAPTGVAVDSAARLVFVTVPDAVLVVSH